MMLRELMDDGENQAVRAFLMLYGGVLRQLSIEEMKNHLVMAGFDGCWPGWVNDPDGVTGLTKGGAQDWLRHLFNLEQGLES